MPALVEEGGSSDRCREVAKAQLSMRDMAIPLYNELYRRVAASPGVPAGTHGEG